MPNLSYLSGRSDVELVTILRDPYERFISNYVFDYRHGFTNETRVQDYVDSKGSFSSFNYYCRLLTSKNLPTLELDNHDLAAAKEQLNLFQYKACVDHKEEFDNLMSQLGWPEFGPAKNRSAVSLRRLASLLIQRDFGLLIRQFRNKRALVDSSFKPCFVAGNQLDFALIRSLD